MLAAKVLTAGGPGQRPAEAGTLGGNDASTNLIAMATVTPCFVPDARDVKVKPDPSPILFLTLLNGKLEVLKGEGTFSFDFNDISSIIMQRSAVGSCLRSKRDRQFLRALVGWPRSRNQHA
jgi:hypothetical protein